MLSHQDYLKVIEKSTLTAVDVIFYYNNKILLGLRNNNPAKGYFFTPGVRTRKLETLSMGIIRVGKMELDIDIEPDEAILIGVYDHIYENNFSNNKFGTHYVVNAYLMNLTKNQVEQINSDQQHSELKWISLDKINDEPKVHQLVKNYLPNIIKNLK